VIGASNKSITWLGNTSNVYCQRDGKGDLKTNLAYIQSFLLWVITRPSLLDIWNSYLPRAHIKQNMNAI